MLYFRILPLLTIIGFISCDNIKLGEEIENGNWTTKHRVSFPFTVGGKHYFFGLTDKNSGRYWFIQELGEDGKTAMKTSQGTWNNYYTKVFPFVINDKQFIYGIDDRNSWFIQEILPGGQMGRGTDSGSWKTTPKIIFPFNIGGKQYVYSLTDTDWVIIEILPHGKFGSKTDNGSWNHYYTLGFPFSINGRQYFYSVGDKYWFIQELLSNGKMGIETDNGNCTTNHTLYVPFSIDDKHYFYCLTDNVNHRYWFIQELLPGGKMGTEKLQGSWKNNYALSFSFNVNKRRFLYGLSEYYWFIQEIIQEPKIQPNDKVLRTKRQNNNGASNSGVGGLNEAEIRVNRIENDDTNYSTMTFSNQANPVVSVSTFRVPADANHPRSIELTAAMRARIHYRHMSSTRDTISSEVYNHLQEMDLEAGDEAGHLLASSLGGPGALFNFAPQSPMLNRDVDPAGSVVHRPGWHKVEDMIRRYLLQANNNGYVRWTLVPVYSLLPVRRPTAFLLSLRFCDSQGNLVDWERNGAVIFYNFPNVPRAASTNPNHPWLNNLRH